jgi:hypothetical protein
MALPKNTTPIYTLRIPSTNKEFKFRPFLVKDEKSLLIAQQSDDVTVMLDTVKDVIKSCSLSNVDVDALASFDIEYMFLQLRAKSVGEIVQLTFQCDEDHGERNIEAQVTIAVNLEEAKVEKFEGHATKIDLFDDVGVMMKYPTIETLKKLETLDANDIDSVFGVTADCIDYIYDSDEVHYTKDLARDELITWLNDLRSEQFEKIQDFFRTMPSLRVYIKYTCPVCGKEHNKYLEGLASFF